MQILVAWRANKWVVERNSVVVGAYAYRTHAIDRARRLTAEAQRLGIRCYMLVREKSGDWRERNGPSPLRDGPDA
jgi:hypothetical protein